MKNENLHTPDTEETRSGDCSVYRRSGSGSRAAHLVFTTAPHSTYCNGLETQFADAQNQFQGGGVMGECYNQLRCCNAPPFLLDKPVI